MIRNFFLSLALMLGVAANSQSVTNSWQIHPFFNGVSIANIIDTNHKVYYLSAGCLFCYDKDTQENESLNKSNYLNDVTVSGIYNDEYNDNVFVAYDNGNIDIIDADGRVHSMVGIKNAQIMGSKTINDITFDDKYAYVATGFGYVVIDVSNISVKESRIYNDDIKTVSHVGGKLVLCLSNKGIFVGDEKKYRETLSSSDYVQSGIYRFEPKITPVDDSHFLLASRSALEMCTIGENGKVSVVELAASGTKQIQSTKGGFVASCPAAACYYTLDANGGNLQRHDAAPGEMVAGKTDLWGINGDGLHKMGDDVNYFRPNSIGVETNAFYANYNPHDKKIYVSSTTDNVVLTNANHGAKTEIWAYDGFLWDDVTPEDVPLYKNGADTYQGSYNLVMLPGESNEYLFTTRTAGLCHVKDGKIVNVYNSTNMPQRDKYMKSIALDGDGNLVTVQSIVSSGYPGYDSKNPPGVSLQNPVMILPKAKLANPATVQASDWICPTVDGLDLNAFKRSSFAIAKDSEIKVFTAGEYHGSLLLWDDKKNIKNLKPTVRSFSFTDLLDQDGGKFEWDYIRCLTPDADGSIWIGTNVAIAKFDPAEAFKAGFHVSRFKVPRNDGTNLADYLLDGIQINCIVPDGSGRKWIGTDNNGLFLVKADGTEILKSFNVDNSPLISNCIYDVCCNPNNNSVFITTSKGVMEYLSDVIPASKDYSEVRVYPNPVRPENGTLVTIAGLMENSLVKIADSAGNVIKQLKSEGGMVTWDCCNDGGDRVSTGVYFVIASQNENGSGSSVVSKFVVIK